MSQSAVEAAPPHGAPAGASCSLLGHLSEHEPIRADLFGLDHLEDHARQLAALARLAPRNSPGHALLNRFLRLGEELDRAHQRIVEASRRREAITPDAEWLLDNYHIVDETLREVRQDLPRGYYRELPKLADGPFAGFPRVYALALELIAHTDSCLDEANITRFVQAYQTVAPLTIGEVWAVPIMLRVGLIENLARLARQMLSAWDDRDEAGSWKGHLLACQHLPPPERDRRLQDPARQPRSRWSDSFVVHLLQALRDHGPDAFPGIEWLENHLTRGGNHPVEVLRREHRRQAANQVSVGNCVTCLRLLSALDWSVFFEKTSLVEAVLRKDPAGVYARQDFPTRDRYRRTIEKLARGSKVDELVVARRAVELAQQAGAGSPGEEARRHVGYYLVGPGRPGLETSIHYRPTWGEWWTRLLLGHPNLFYFGALTALTLLGLAVLTSYGWQEANLHGTNEVLPVLLLLFFGVLPASELAVGLVHYLITLVLSPRVLPKLDFRKGIPPDCATFVVMPTMLLRRESAEGLAGRLEIHYLSNPDPQLRYALLTDFADAPAEHMPEDEAYLRAALEKIHELNARYAPGGPDRFFLFHRRRQWNPVQNCWMGWERKRGKLSEFNRLLRGATDTSYTTVSGDLGRLPRIRFVITLDADTQLPREAAQRLVATLAHPLNQPRFDARQGRVVEGYGVLQPRVSLGLTSAARSLFAKLLTGSAGIDPYTTAVSDVYQDLFGRGTFTGKGIYDVDAFEAAVGHAFPDNRILSHDLIEGNYARCGLVTDIEFLDEFPARYLAYARREHRWVRGDWQILPWLFRRVPAPGPGGRVEKRPNTLPALERWKIFDNLRRSLVPPGLVVLAVLGWTVLPGSPWFWTVLTLFIPALPLFFQMIGAGISLSRSSSWKLELRALGHGLKSTGGQVVLSLVFLLGQASLLVDAIFRTLFRTCLSRKHLLEWETAASTERRLSNRLLHVCFSMGWVPVLAAAIGVLVGLVRPGALPAALTLVVPWFFSPLIAYWVSQPLRVREAPLTPADRRILRRVARKTWGFFETFVGVEDHWLPPDNFQEDPKGVAAHRTSPTNVGLYLLSCLAAHDLGYLSLPALVDRLEKTLDTLEGLDRFHGHFYNWFDTETLQPLQPLYISTVDSGNLLASLLTLRQGLREKVEEPVPGPAVKAGLADTLELAAEQFRAIEPPSGADSLAPFHSLDATFGELGKLLQENPGNLLEWEDWLRRINHQAGELTGHTQALAEVLGEMPADLQRWAQSFADLAFQHLKELNELAPWLIVVRAARLPDTSPERQRRGGPVAGAPGLYEAGEPPALRDEKLRDRLLAPVSVAGLQAEMETLLTEVAASGKGETNGESSPLREAVAESNAAALLARCQALADRAGALAQGMDFRILYNEQRHLFSIGYNQSAGKMDNAHYDLLASESCLTSFLAIARGEVPRRHWFQLGRLLTPAAGSAALLSWGGTMFEYLMPRLFFRDYPGTLMDISDRAAVDRQIEYGRQNRVPWGISESGYSALDAGLDYQYQSFGVPGLGLKRGLGRDLVIAPYATALALAVHPRAAVVNFGALAGERAEGPYGFYEAIDYTRDRLQEKRRSAVVRSYMAHHQGMTLLALDNCLLGEPNVRRFHGAPMVQATELLLQERMPAAAPLVQAHRDESQPPPVVREGLLPMSRRLTSPDTPHPRVHLLSGNQYAVMITNAGAGASASGGLDVTRWREDRTRDCWGQFCYVRDLRSGLLWSAGFQPLARVPDEYEVIFSTDKAEFRRVDAGIETRWEITVSPENRAEVRRVTLTNLNNKPHELELTSYAEVVLAPHRADLAHPAFGKLFLETEFVRGEDALLCRRRPRSADQEPVWGVHVVAVDGPAVGPVQYETSRANFLGRGRTTANPAALEPGAALTGTTGPVLDPIFSLRRRVRVAPGASVAVAFTTAVARTREEALALADQYHETHAITRAFELAWAHSQVELRHLRLSGEEAHLYQRLAAQVVYAGPTLRPAQAVAANRQGQPALWRYGISGDLPIVLVRIAETEELQLARQLLTAHSYWRLKGLEVDLVIVNDHTAGYREEVQQQLQELIRSSDAHLLVDKPGGVFLRLAAQIPEEDPILLQAAARVVLVGNRGSLSAQLDRVDRQPALPPPLKTPGAAARAKEAEPPATPPTVELHFANGLGGFTPDGREYVITVAPRPTPAGKDKAPRPPLARNPFRLPPAPWVNVIANPNCGFFVSEGGGGYTWAGNSQMNRLTPWSNDPVSDPPGEILYLRDEATGEFWTPTPLPLGPGAPVRVRHGQGYTVFASTSHGLEQELLLLVPPEDPIKLIRLRVRNTGSRPRALSAAFYAEWVLGTVRDQAAMQVVPAVDPETEALVAHNAFNADFAGRVAFADVSLRPRTFTTDRTEFLGRNGSPAAPAALGRVELSGAVGPLVDPCAALLGKFELAPGQEQEVVFFLGQVARPEDLAPLLRRYRQPGQVEKTLAEVRALWDRVLTGVQVRTPNTAMDLMLNRWLLYQDLSCRVWGRSAFYQSGGAYGFRDQFQDVMALVYGAPEEARAQILRAAGRQFLEGDVQHWWHPPVGRGVRTHFSDDYLWLPLVVCHYVTTTGDAEVLDQRVPFLRGPKLRPGQEEDYGLPEVTEETGTVYEHCVRALENGQGRGPHGLPLMGTGDWNDGMNRVGAEGRGESVWDGWFQVVILRRFAALAEQRGDAARAGWCRAEAEKLRAALEENAWDGRWYRRAYFDDGTPLGSAANDECQIDSIVQSWAVLSEVADPERTRQGMAAVEERLVRDKDKMILLFDPPFNQGPLQPGYIKGYLPGIRENGGQYTHAATWVVEATALQGRGKRAVELFDMLNPISHSSTPEQVARYLVEPYVVVADIYSQPPHVGRGGWTWYTGSAGWLYRVALEGILGFRLEGTRLRLEPCIPPDWPQFELMYRHRTATYHITVDNPSKAGRGVTRVEVDGAIREDQIIELADDGRIHEVRVVLGG